MNNTKKTLPEKKIDGNVITYYYYRKDGSIASKKYIKKHTITKEQKEDMKRMKEAGYKSIAICYKYNISIPSLHKYIKQVLSN